MITESQIRAAIKNAAAGTKPTVMLKDDGERGAGRLALLVRALSGKVATEWYAVYYRDGKRSLTKIGSFPGLSLADARKVFREEYAPVISAGAAPDRKHVRSSHKNGGSAGTVRELFTAYVASLRADNKRSAETVERILLSKKSGAVESIGGARAASSVEPDDIVGLLAAIHSRGSVVSAARTRAYISAAFSWGMHSEHSYTGGEHTGLRWGIKANPAQAIASDSNANRTRDRFLSPKEFRAFWLWLEDQKSKSKVASALMIQLATGQRTEECLRISDAGFDRGMVMLNWPKTKNSFPHSIPVVPRVVSILEALTPNAHGLYFPHRDRPDTPAHHATVHKLVLAFIDDTGAEPFIPRDLRRTWKTLAGQAGIQKEMRDRLQNHAGKQDVSQRHYDRYDYLPEKRAAIATWATYMDWIIAGKIDNDVVRLQSAAE